jgi:hypothetical protein
VEETAHIIVAAEVVNTSSDVQQLPVVLSAVQANTGLAELAITQPDTELVIALGREAKVLAKPRDAQRYPHTVCDGRQVRNRARKDCLPKTQVDCRATRRLDQERSGIPPVQHERG